MTPVSSRSDLPHAEERLITWSRSPFFWFLVLLSVSMVTPPQRLFLNGLQFLAITRDAEYRAGYLRLPQDGGEDLADELVTLIERVIRPLQQCFAVCQVHRND